MKTHRLKTCATGDTQVANLCYEKRAAGMGTRRLRGAARAREPALLTSGAMDGGAKAGSSERRAGCPERASGDGHGQPRAEGRPGVGTLAENLCYGRHDRQETQNKTPSRPPRDGVCFARPSVRSISGRCGIAPAAWPRRDARWRRWPTVTAGRSCRGSKGRPNSSGTNAWSAAAAERAAGRKKRLLRQPRLPPRASQNAS